MQAKKERERIISIIRDLWKDEFYGMRLKAEHLIKVINKPIQPHKSAIVDGVDARK